MSDREPIIPAGHEKAYERFQFAPAFRVGDTIYVSGVIGRDAAGQVPEAPDAEYAAVFEGLRSVLSEAGASLADIVDMTSFHTDFPNTMGDFMKAKAASLVEPFPAWTAIGCTVLAAPGARVEVKATAVLSQQTT